MAIIQRMDGSHMHTVKNVREKCNVEITRDHVLSRCKTFDKHCSTISKLLARSEFGWDRNQKMIVIHNEDAWKMYIQVGYENSFLLFLTGIRF